MTTPVTALPTGLLLSESILHADGFKVLATFVALNTLMYATLALMKLLPKGYTFSWFRGRNRRSQSRSIYPEPAAGVPQVPHQRSAPERAGTEPVEHAHSGTHEGEPHDGHRRPASATARPSATARTRASATTRT
uniref:hypothetical protein n=1 Tax=Actinotalea sp. TaxID=1872145 RepID=UPI0035670900